MMRGVVRAIPPPLYSPTTPLRELPIGVYHGVGNFASAGQEQSAGGRLARRDRICCEARRNPRQVLPRDQDFWPISQTGAGRTLK